MQYALARVIYAVFYFLSIYASLFFELFEKGSQRPLGAIVWLQDVLRLPNVVFRVFVDRIICKVHEGVFEVLVCWFLVLFGAETYQALIADKSLDLIVLGKSTDHSHINSEVIFEAVDEHRLINIPLDDVIGAEMAHFELKLAKISKKENTTTFGCLLGLRNIAAVFMFFHITLQLGPFFRVFELRRHEIKATGR